MRLTKLFSELRKRHLYRIAVLYMAVGWLLLQVADVVSESFGWPDWAMQGLIVVLQILYGT